MFLGSQERPSVPTKHSAGFLWASLGLRQARPGWALAVGWWCPLRPCRAEGPGAQPSSPPLLWLVFRATCRSPGDSARVSPVWAAAHVLGTELRPAALLLPWLLVFRILSLFLSHFSGDLSSRQLPSGWGLCPCRRSRPLPCSFCRGRVWGLPLREVRIAESRVSDFQRSRFCITGQSSRVLSRFGSPCFLCCFGKSSLGRLLFCGAISHVCHSVHRPPASVPANTPLTPGQPCRPHTGPGDVSRALLGPEVVWESGFEFPNGRLGWGCPSLAALCCD